jgi:hypothetical protein
MISSFVSIISNFLLSCSDGVSVSRGFGAAFSLYALALYAGLTLPLLKQRLHNTGFAPVGLKGTSHSAPQVEHVVWNFSDDLADRPLVPFAPEDLVSFLKFFIFILLIWLSAYHILSFLL